MLFVSICLNYRNVSIEKIMCNDFIVSCDIYWVSSLVICVWLFMQTTDLIPNDNAKIYDSQQTYCLLSCMVRKCKYSQWTNIFLLKYSRWFKTKHPRHVIVWLNDKLYAFQIDKNILHCMTIKRNLTVVKQLYVNIEKQLENIYQIISMNFVLYIWILWLFD